MSISHDKSRPFARTLEFISVVVAYGLTAAGASELARVGLFTWPAPTASDIEGWPAQYVVLLLIALLARGGIAAGLQVDMRGRDNDLRTSMPRLVSGALIWTATIGVSIFLFKLSDVSRLFVLCFVCSGSVLAVVGDRLGRFVTERRSHRQGLAVVIASGAQGDWLTGYLRRHFSPRPYALVKRIGDDELGKLGMLGEETKKWLSSGDGRKVYMEAFVAGADTPGDAGEVVPQLIKYGIKTHLLPAVFDASMFRLSLSNMGGVPLITVQGGELDPLEAGVKRAIDFIGSLVALGILSPLLVGISLVVKMTSPGPVLFRQERLGKNGNTIYIYKFRTMREDAESILKADAQLYQKYVSNNYKLPKGRDPRITAVGRVLRQLSLDELPQLINVIKGEMSLVGPRPVVPEEIRQYGDCASMVLSVQPGLTGQWQVSGRSDIADYAQRVRLDMEYLRDQSIATDLRILAKTLPAVLLRQGAH